MILMLFKMAITLENFIFCHILEIDLERSVVSSVGSLKNNFSIFD